MPKVLKSTKAMVRYRLKNYSDELAQWDFVYSYIKNIALHGHNCDKIISKIERKVVKLKRLISHLQANL